MHLTIYFFIWIVFIGGFEQEKISSLSHELKNPPSLTNLNSTCRLTDSLVLVDLYNAANGPAWTNSWNLNLSMDNWEGVILNSNGCLDELRLSNRGLDGTVPTTIGNFSEITLLHLDNNNLQGQLPPSLGNLTDLKTLFLDDNIFTGPVPSEIGNITSLNTLFIDNNRLSGEIPISFLGMNNLTNLEFFGNKIDSVPDLSSIMTLIIQNNKLKMSNNALTFDDIIPNLSASLGDNYHPQDSVFQEITYNLNTGDTFDINLEIDEGITNSSYRWYKDGSFFAGPLSAPILPIGNVNWDDAGVYHCEITNPDAPLLTLHSRPITIQVSCGTSFGTLNGSFCSNQDFIVNGNIYNQNNPTGTEFIAMPDQYGCDSVVNINLQFISNTTSVFEPAMCESESYVINGVTYDINNPIGIETLSGQAFNGCDSIITINITPAPPSENNINEVLCSGESISVNGTTYDLNNPSGVQTLPNQNYVGCDSIITVDLAFHSLAEGFYDQELCSGASFTIGSIVFDESNPSGAATLPNQSYSNCDSIVYVNLTFADAITATFSPTLCIGDSRIINGVTYDINNPTGSEFFPNGSFIGCDSVVNINLTYQSLSEGFINETLCEGASRIVGGTTFDFFNPTGAIILENQSYFGCDSTVFVNLSFTPKQEIFRNELLCQGEFIQINGITYDANNPSGVATLPAQQAGHCDSTLYIDLTYLPLAEGLINENKCQGESVVVNDITFDFNNPTGAVSFNGQGFNGCDSTVYINLTFRAASENFVNELLCIGDSRTVNGNTYNESNPMGAEFFPNQNQYGCDSTVYINLAYLPAAENFVANTLCTGTSLLINDTTYDAANPTGTEMLPGMGFNGCDSTIYVDLSFTDVVVNAKTELLCVGDAVVVNNTTYDAINPTGTETFPSGSYIGCDSIVEINLSFYESPLKALNPILCGEDFVEVNGVVYNQSNLSGTEILIGGAYLGCDSIVEINLTYQEAIPTQLTPTICNNHFYTFNGVVYDMDNPSGIETFSGMAYNGCDSIVEIALVFYETEIGTYTPSTCNNGSILFNGTVYDMSNPSGTEVLVNQSYFGCDSTVNVQVEFVESIETMRTDQLCTGQSITVNETIYNIDNATGMEEMVSFNGCDSIVIIDLAFSESVASSLTQNICPDEELTVNGNIYDANNLTGTEILANASYLDCDSVVTINLNLLSASNTFYNQTLCESQIVELHGQIFDVNNPFGIIELDQPNAQGCDSLLIVELMFNPPSTSEIISTICNNETITVNGVVYGMDNPTGTEILVNGNYLGCDSTIFINLNFGAAIATPLEETICEGETINFDGQQIGDSGMYTQTIPGGSFLGCDSIVTLNLIIENPVQLGMANAGVDEVLCENEVTLNANLPAGTTGSWSTNSTFPIADESQPTILLENIPSGIHEMIWTLSSNLCGEYSSDAMLISMPNFLVANEDTYDIVGNDGNENMLDITANDTTESDQNTVVNITSAPTSGTATTTSEGNIEYVAEPDFEGTVIVEYEICDEFCPDNCSNSVATIHVSQMAPAIDRPNIPNAITANEDGLNDEWIIDVLETQPEAYPNNRLTIINRWGERIFTAAPYLNNWDGTDQNGLPLPAGTYYYTLILNLGDGEIYKGDITILR